MLAIKIAKFTPQKLLLSASSVALSIYTHTITTTQSLALLAILVYTGRCESVTQIKK